MAIRRPEAAAQKLRAGGARDRITGCLLWTGAITSAGYGAVWLDGASRLVHVVQYELAHGPKRHGHVIAHECDNTRCFELSHLTMKTQRENMADACTRGRMPSLTMDPDRVREVRALEGKAKARDVAVSYGVTSRLIYRIWNRTRWGFVADA